MDQDAFRNLLAAPSRPGTGRAAGVLGAPQLKRGHGGTAKAKDLAPKKDEKPAFAPRKVFKKDSKYQDRAEMRRLGLDDEFKPVEKLLEDFEKRAQEEGDDEATIQDKRRYLGGDASHSVLVKGLDFALLAARKAELEAKDSNDFDTALDEVLETVGSSGVQQKEIEGKGKSKLSRDEIVRELKRKRELAESHGKEEDVMGVGLKKSRLVAEEEPKAAPLGSKFKSIAQKKAEAQAAEEAKLKKKKKKKKVVPIEEPASVVEPSLPAMRVEEDQDLEQPMASSSMLPGAVQVQSEEMVKQDSPEIEDIFGGVGDYQGLVDSDSGSDEEGEVTSRSIKSVEKAPPSAIHKSGGKWFAADEDDDRPATVASSSKYPPAPSLPAARSGSLSRSPSPEPTTLRLVPLSSSALPSAKDLLALDKAAVAAEKKKEKKAKWRAKQGLSKQGGDEDDDDEENGGGWRGKEDKEDKSRDNREAQRLTAYMAKKEMRA